MTVKNMFEKSELQSLMVLEIFSGYKVTKGTFSLFLLQVYRFRCNWVFFCFLLKFAVVYLLGGQQQLHKIYTSVVRKEASISAELLCAWENLKTNKTASLWRSWFRRNRWSSWEQGLTFWHDDLKYLCMCEISVSSLS